MGKVKLVFLHWEYGYHGKKAVVDSETTVRVLVHKGGMACFGDKVGSVHGLYWMCVFFYVCACRTMGLKILFEGTGRDHEGSFSRLIL